MLDKNRGLTSSEASRVKNFLKELVKTINVGEGLNIVTSSALRGGNKLPLDTHAKIEDWKEKIRQKSRYYSLSAWLGEAILYKEKLLKKTKNETFDGEYEGMMEKPEPPNKKSTEWDEFFSTLSVKEQSEYLTNDTYAAHIGKFIHNFDEIREVFNTFQPTQFRKISDVETLTIVNTLLYNEDELIEGVESLQGEHRTANKVVNFWKAKYKEWVAEREREYYTELSKYQSDLQAITLSNRAAFNKAAAEFEKEKTSKLEEIAVMKITIPNELQDVLDEVMKKFEG